MTSDSHDVSTAKPRQRHLKVLYVHHNPDTYGASRSLLRLLGNLDRSLYTPVVLLAEAGPLKQLLEKMGVEVIIQPVCVITRPVFRSWRIIKFLADLPITVLSIRKLIREKGIDLVHTNTGVIVSAGMAAKLAGVPHIWHIRDWFQEFKAMWHPYSRYILWSSTRVIAVSAAIAKQFPSNNKVMVIHNGFSLEEFNVEKELLREHFRRQYGIGSDFLIGCVGRIKLVRKGQEILIKAAARLKEKGVRAKYILVGAPFPGNEEHLESIKKLIKELGLESDVILTGELADTKPSYSAMDIFVLPSAQPEPFGGVVMEAMAMGVPVIATNIGGSIDQVADGETGFLVPPADSETLAQKIELLIKDTNLRCRLGQNGPKRIAQVFSLQQMIHKIEHVYRLAAEDNGRSDTMTQEAQSFSRSTLST